ncbi:hypothetical protein J2Z22_003803 [Paenibacillus forsythiae]|uniref:Uncharacterized protein n=1 Tax=Paenibacillus forsythiae TaxID=365616 RepID=A0ABU3HBL7_9BACL|nr:hypothetical protein [Paenibacillus forsythiae]MDT3428212.1 hypothetical protein [Paenibacillus forsythiae]
MNAAAARTSLKVDDYLDLFNLAVKVGDLKWQKEIKARLRFITYKNC